MIRLAGEAAYKRGVGYYREDRVGPLRHKGKSVIAEVDGSETYQVVLTHTGKVFEGVCDCPASDGVDFCKHCVAAALVYRDALQQELQLQSSKNKDRLPTYLMGMSKEALVELLMEQLKNDRDMLAQLTIKADLAAGKLNDRAIKKQITAAMPLNRNLFRYAQVRSYFARLETVLDNLDSVILDLPPAKALALIDYSFDRIERALHTIDDSGGFRLAVLAQLGRWHRHILDASALTEAQLAQYLFERFMSPACDFYPEIPGDYRDLLGDAGMRDFIALIRQAWDALPPMQEKDWERMGDYYHLRGPLEDDAETRQDHQLIIDLHAKTAVDFRDFLMQSERCLEHGQLDQALVWRQRAERVAGKQYHYAQALEDNQIAIDLYNKQYAPVVELLWQRFAKQPGMEGYQKILAIPKQRDGKSNRNKAIELATIAAANTSNAYLCWQGRNTLAELYLHFEQPEDALRIAETHQLESVLLVQVAQANPDHAGRGLPLLYGAVRHLIDQSNNKSYQDAIDILKHARALAGDRYRAAIIDELAGILVEYKRKRNFCSWVREAFAEVS
ncbi:hypothetical protein NCG89_16285 [Spongiibacter taiwanensis]|uniref:SWIM zinc finger family protein n=1 Tax=Spongiibacter taiwanensis TaxID=1748242 RepID=UPI00203645E8|nr:hypothetical protein [Spongiibacter taiwanensis]USA43084.1 hypothetical protein NCG89_16285 [Spongiibacter taiwanensis]